jgi:hypothetical protein
MYHKWNTIKQNTIASFATQSHVYILHTYSHDMFQLQRWWLVRVRVQYIHMRLSCEWGNSLLLSFSFIRMNFWRAFIYIWDGILAVFHTCTHVQNRCIPASYKTFILVYAKVRQVQFFLQLKLARHHGTLYITQLRLGVVNFLNCWSCSS